MAFQLIIIRIVGIKRRPMIAVKTRSSIFFINYSLASLWRNQVTRERTSEAIKAVVKLAI
jgi:hypothetical protein